MDEHTQQLDALTNQRVEIALGDKKYTARRATLKDFAAINRFRHEKAEAHDTANIELDVALFALSELLKPAYSLTPEQLSELIPLDHVLDVNHALENLGFKLPQADTPTASTGANSTE